MLSNSGLSDPGLSSPKRQPNQSANRDQNRGETGRGKSLPSVFQQTEANRRDFPRSEGGRWGHVYAALDLGTNNCRLLVARPRRSGFTVIDAYSRTVCLGEGLETTGRLSAKSMDRALDALRICVAKMERRGVTVARSIATQACRTASNGTEFLARIRRETGLIFEIITPAEEAWLAATGCWPLVDRSCSTALVFDIGGGSTELIWLDLSAPDARGQKPNIVAWTSLPCGVVNLTEKFGTPHLEPAAYAPMVAHVRTALERFGGADGRRPDFGCPQAHIVGTSGTVTTLAGLLLGLERYDRDRVDGIWLDMDRVRDLVGDLASRSAADRATLTCVGTDRADFVLAGCAILEAIDSLWPTPRLRVADRGLREGILLSLMAQADRRRGRRNGPKQRMGR